MPCYPALAMPTDTLSNNLLTWFASHGRKDLPWQINPTSYRVWVSEIMLQQTQVATVIPYYQKFMARFADVRELAVAPLDDVLHLWSGLGYYARGRNLHRAAGIVREHYRGQVPHDFETLAELPGIGRSTAGAILALSTGQRYPILDGNVKRVLSRVHAVEGWYGLSEVSTRLWELAEGHTPKIDVAAYTQAIMDLGATLCTRRQPDCAHCPLQAQCTAFREGSVADYPTPKPRRVLPVRESRVLLLRNSTGEVLLQRRPPVGIWGGLWSFPEVPVDQEPQHWCLTQLRCRVRRIDEWPKLRHTFSHFHLDLRPLVAQVKTLENAVLEGEGWVWYNSAQPDRIGLAAPVTRLLARLQDYTD